MDKIKILRVIIVLVVLVACLMVFKIRPWNITSKSAGPNLPKDVSVPSIINGDLILPKITTSTGNSGTLFGNQHLGVVSANLFPIFDQQSQKMSGIRILGETADLGSDRVNALSPVVKFYDKDNKVLGQKLAHLSTGFEFLGVEPSQPTIYDVTVDNPPVSDKLEIIINSESASGSAFFEPLLIASRSMEIKSATYQGNQLQDASSSSVATGSAKSAENVEYYSLTGSVVNGLTDPVTDIVVYAWVKNKDNKVFAFAKQNFTNDLVQPNDKLDFRILLLPLKNGEHFETYELVAKGKRYKLKL